MRPLVRSSVIVTGLLIAASAGFAAERVPKADAPPPPGINDPGVTAVPADKAAPAQAAPAAAADNDPLAPLPKPDSRLVRDKASRDGAASPERMAASEVTKRQQGDDTVEEYREKGHVWMIRIVPQNGPMQTFMDNDGSGRLNRDPREGPVSPVYYTLYEWK